MKINVSYSKTVNLGNYNSMKVEAGMEIETTIEEYKKDFDFCWREVKSQVEEQISEG